MSEILLDSVRYAALARSSWLLIGLARMLPVHRRARTRRWGSSELLALLELFVFLALTGWLLVRPPASGASGPLVAFGAACAWAGVAVSVWAIATTVRQGVILDGGHFVKREHPLVTTGAYGFVRNPMYLGILLLWLGIAAAWRHAGLALFAAVYVLPVFLLYIRSEDRMMAREFGASWQAYRRRVGSLLPRLRRSHA